MDLNSWFLGFFEADGCLTYQRTDRGECVASMEISQSNLAPGRIATILFGGRLNHVIPRSKMRGTNKLSAPRWTWQLRDKCGLLEAVWFFDQHPIIGPKKKEYKTWRAMVLRYVTHGCSDGELLELCDHLSTTRKSKQKNFGRAKCENALSVESG